MTKLSTLISGGFIDDIPNLSQNRVMLRNFNHYEKQSANQNFLDILQRQTFAFNSPPVPFKSQYFDIFNNLKVFLKLLQQE